MARVQKIWTDAEKKSAKLTIALQYRSGKIKTECKPLILRPATMTIKHYNSLLKILELYGTVR